MGKRIAGYENVKIFLMFLVVLGHIIENEYSIDTQSAQASFMAIYFFHMPAFIFLSGLMNKVDGKIRWKKVFSYIVLGYAYKIMNTLLIGIGTGKWQFSLLKENGIPWFMFVMAACLVLSQLVKDIKPVVVVIGSILLGCMIGFDKTLSDGTLVLGRTIVYFPFYILGCYLQPKKVMQFCKQTWCRCAAAVIVLGYLGIMYGFTSKIYNLRHIVTGKNPYSEWALQHGHVLLRMGCYLGAMIIIFALISLIPDREIPSVTVRGSSTLAVYFWHRNVIRVLHYTGILHAVITVFGGGIWVAVPIALLMTFVLSWKPFEKPLTYIMEGIYR